MVDAIQAEGEKSMLGRTLVISGGHMDLLFAAEYLKGQTFDTVVCADSGLNAAFALKLPVQYFMGDFDSVSADILNQYQSRQVEDSVQAEWIRYPREKDATDTHMVLDWVVERQPSEVVILGATGGRMDHFLANLNLLMLPLRQQIPAYILDRQNKIYLIDRDTTVYAEQVYGKYISLQPLTEKVTGITLRGFQYLLDDFTMTIGGSRGVSNELAEGAAEASIQLKDGVLIVIESKDT